MPKVTKFPRLRTKVYKGAGGQVYVYYVYDMRPDGKPDIRLGSDYALALERWNELHNDAPRAVGLVQEAATRWREHEVPKYTNPDTRKSYLKQLARIEAVFGAMPWDEVTLPMLRAYLDRRFVKRQSAEKGPRKLATVQGNRELSVFSIVWGKARLWGMTKLHWPGEGVKDWKNPEVAREFEVTDRLFAAVYAQADQVLRDCMDIATATGMRLTDARTVRLPADGRLQHRTSKTGKWATFDVAQSPVLSALVERRLAMRAHSVMLLSTATGRQVSAGMLRSRYDDARDRAALAALEASDPDLADQIRGMYLRDMRSRAADLADDLDGASELLQHSSKRVTAKHYRTKATTLKAVR